MDDKNKKAQDVKQKQWEDKVDIAAAKVKLAGHKAEEKWNDFSDNAEKTAQKLSEKAQIAAGEAKEKFGEWTENAKGTAKHVSNVAKEKATEAKNTLDETIQKAQNRLDEALHK